MAGADKPFSQLDFDRPTAAIEAPRKPTAEDLKVILDAAGTPAVAGVQPLAPVAKPPANSSPKSDTTSRARLSVPEPRSSSDSRFDWVKPEDGASHVLVPRLKGPMVDPEDTSTITTTAAWKREGSACQDVASSSGICGKALALRELLNRFSGSDDFYNGQCSQTCPNPGDRAVLVGFAVKKVEGSEFNMIEENKGCRYQITAAGDPPQFHMFQGERGTCQCVPSTCSS